MKVTLGVIVSLMLSSSSAFVTNKVPPKFHQTLLHAKKDLNRLSFLQSTAAVTFGTLTSLPYRTDALVKGNAPPPKKGPSEERKCRNVEECQEMAERLAAKQEEEARANMVPASVAEKGTRYRDIAEAEDGSAVAKVGDSATVFYKVLKLGKRSYDGLSGEGTVVFSRGYGLEDDEDKPGVKTFSFKIGEDSQIIGALSDGIIGQKVGSIRRIGVTPQMGWERATRECDGGPGGQGSGGELKTDYVVVPTATMVATETCFDKTKLPFPSTYAEQRRMAQRFDQSLIIEVELVALNE